MICGTHGEKEAPCFEAVREPGANYILPQRARMDHIDQFLDVFSANDIYKDISIVVKSRRRRNCALQARLCGAWGNGKIRIPPSC